MLCHFRLFVLWDLSSTFCTHMETLSLLAKGCKFGHMLSTHGHWAVWGSFSVPHLRWHGASVYNGRLRGPVTFAPVAERLAVELSLPVFTTKICRGWDSNTQPSAFGTNALIHCATAAVFIFVKYSVLLEGAFTDSFY